MTDATPELFVTAITFEPLLVPLEREPALVVNRMLAPVLVPPDWPGVKVTVSACGNTLPALADWLLPLVLAKVAAGLPTTIHPPWV